MGQMTVVFSHTYGSEVERVDNLMLGMRKRVDLLVLDERRSAAARKRCLLHDVQRLVDKRNVPNWFINLARISQNARYFSICAKLQWILD